MFPLVCKMILDGAVVLVTARSHNPENIYLFRVPSSQKLIQLGKNIHWTHYTPSWHSFQLSTYNKIYKIHEKRYVLCECLSDKASHCFKHNNVHFKGIADTFGRRISRTAGSVILHYIKLRTSMTLNRDTLKAKS